MADKYDVIVIGGGPAGLTAAIYALRANKSVLVIEKGNAGGQMNFSPCIENYPGFAKISGLELADKFVEHVLDQGGNMEIEEVLSVTDTEGGKLVKTDFGEHIGKAVVVATGARHRLLGVPGEDALLGKGISFCAVCDGAFYAGKHVAVVGGGNSALQEALLLADQCSKVTILQNLEDFTGEQKLVELYRSKGNTEAFFGVTVSGFSQNAHTVDVKVKNIATGEEEVRSFDGVFIAIGLIPESGPVKDVVETDKYGTIVSDEKCLTKDPAIFVAGDCRTKNVRQISTACADGATAALAACRYIDANA